MGIVNVTPDSFSDGGKYWDPDAAVRHALQLAADGADILDVGGESTRPYSNPVSESEELRRVVPVVKAIAQNSSVPVSIDTSKASVAFAAIEAGAQIINDVTGLEGDPDMVQVAKETQSAVCVMHMQGTPQNMQDKPRYEDVVRDVVQYLTHRRDSLCSAGIDRRRICLDVGIGFGKSTLHNLQLIQAVGALHALSQPLLVGHSRKGFLRKVLGNHVLDQRELNRGAPDPIEDAKCVKELAEDSTDRMAETVEMATMAVGLALASSGVQLLRVHDTQAMRAAMLAYAAVGGVDGSISASVTEVPGGATTLRSTTPP